MAVSTVTVLWTPCFHFTMVTHEHNYIPTTLSHSILQLSPHRQTHGAPTTQQQVFPLCSLPSVTFLHLFFLFFYIISPLTNNIDNSPALGCRRSPHGLPHLSSISSPKEIHKRYMDAVNELKDSTKPKVCLTLTRKSQGEDITKQLPSDHHSVLAT